MRPKKRVLVIDSDEDRLGLLRFQLETWGFAVLAATSAGKARKLASQAELIVAAADFRAVRGLLKEFYAADPLVRHIVIAQGEGCNLIADALLRTPSGMELFAAVKCFSVARRGPRPAEASMTYMRQQLLCQQARRVA